MREIIAACPEIPVRVRLEVRDGDARFTKSYSLIDPDFQRGQGEPEPPWLRVPDGRAIGDYLKDYVSGYLKGQRPGKVTSQVEPVRTLTFGFESCKQMRDFLTFTGVPERVVVEASGVIGSKDTRFLLTDPIFKGEGQPDWYPQNPTVAWQEQVCAYREHLTEKAEARLQRKEIKIILLNAFISFIFSLITLWLTTGQT